MYKRQVYSDVKGTLAEIAAVTTEGSFQKAFVGKLGNAKDILPKVSGYSAFRLEVTNVTKETADVKVFAVGKGEGAADVQLWPEVAATAAYGK